MTNVSSPPPVSGSLAYFPVTFFAVTMGLSGLTLAFQAAERGFALSYGVSTMLYVLTLSTFFAVCCLYGFKALKYPQFVVQEWAHPVRLAFFPAITISLLLLSAATLDRSEPVARVVWCVAALGHAGLTLAVVSGWISTRSFQTGHLNPAWFIPAVGNVIAPIAGAPLGFIELSWYFMAVGLIFWIVLMTLVINRLIFHDPLPGRLQPTLVILIAPPGVAFVAWVGLQGEVDAFARILLNGAYFFAAVVALQLPNILRLPFALSHWALSFPIAAVTVASFVFAQATGSLWHLWIGVALLAVLCVVITGLVIRTAQAQRRGQICVPE